MNIFRHLAVAALLGTVSAQAQIPYPNPFRHVVVIIQENRTPDNLFQGLLTWPGIRPGNYDIATKGINSTGKVIPLAPEPLGVPYDLSHAHAAFVAMYNGGKMDGADKIPCSGTCPVNPQFYYVDNSTHTIDPYLTLAADYGWANFMFQTNQGPSYPAHQFLFGGTSARSAPQDAAGIFVAENPGVNKGATYTGFSDTGCLAPLGEFVGVIEPGHAETKISNTGGTFCFSRDTMASLLDSAGLSWKYYAQSQAGVNPGGSNAGGSIWTAPNSIQEICVPNANFTQCTGAEWTANVDLNPADVLTDISSCKLPRMSWVTPAGTNSDHPGSKYTTGGPSWVASVVNAIGSSTTCDGTGYWYDTAILITWDDWGGWYDHEAPTILTGVFGDYQYGFRVPLIVVSAYTPAAYVSNERLDFGSILRFIEGVFNLPEGGLNFADARATSDLASFFEFKKQARSFQSIPAPLNADFFIHDKRPQEPPDND